MPSGAVNQRVPQGKRRKTGRAPRVVQTAAVLKDTLFADVSEWQHPVDDSYPYQVLSIRVSDGTYRDHNFAANYAWMRGALDSGRLVFGIVYTYCRPNWLANATTVRAMIDANGGLHPRIALMLDVEQGGQPTRRRLGLDQPAVREPGRVHRRPRPHHRLWQRRRPQQHVAHQTQRDPARRRRIRQQPRLPRQGRPPVHRRKRIRVRATAGRPAIR